MLHIPKTLSKIPALTVCHFSNRLTTLSKSLSKCCFVLDSRQSRTEQKP